jgi:uncharacterized membrane protein
MSNNNDFILREMTAFGKNMQAVAICIVLTIVPYLSYVTSIVAFVFIIMALNNIRNINSQLNNILLAEYRSRYIPGFIIRLIGTFALSISLNAFPRFNFYYPSLFNVLAISVPAIVGLILMIIGGSIEMSAWDRLKLFFEENQSIFPEYFQNKAIYACEKLRTGALLYALGFLIITILIGFILQVIGYFSLAKFNQLTSSYVQPGKPQPPIAPGAPKPPQAPQAPIPPLEQKKFCPNCGAQIKEGGKFCAECGSPLD